MTGVDRAAYELVRRGAAAVPAPRDAVEVAGPDAAEYLQGQCSQDLDVLDDGGSAEALLLSPQGKLQALVRVTRLAGDRWVVDVDAGWGDTVVARLLQFRLRVKADVAPLPWRTVALRGPGVADLLPPGGAPPGTAVVAPVSWAGVTGVDLLGPDPQMPDGVTEVPAPVWEAVRVEAGIPRMGAELDERTIAAEAGLLDRAVSFTKGCYTGQELVARLDARGNRVARRLRGVVVAQGAPRPASGWVVAVGDRVVGACTSVADAPALGTVAALAYVHRDVEPPSAVSLHPVAEGRTVAGGGVSAVAEVRVLPLVDPGRAAGEPVFAAPEGR